MRPGFAIWSTWSSLLLLGCTLPPLCITKSMGAALHVKDQIWVESRMPRGRVGVLFLFTVELGGQGTNMNRKQRSVACVDREALMARDPRFPHSPQTIYPKNHTRPLKGKYFEKAKAAEAARAKADPYYITADAARALPQEARDLPDIQQRIEHSRHDWPENKAAATIALGPLDTGEGERVEERKIETDTIFEGSKIETAAAPITEE